MHCYDVAPVATAEERVAGRFRPTESAFPVKVDKVPALKDASIAWQDSEDMLWMQRLSLFVSQLALSSASFINPVAFGPLLRIGRLPLAHSWPLLAYRRVAFYRSPAMDHARTIFPSGVLRRTRCHIGPRETISHSSPVIDSVRLATRSASSTLVKGWQTVSCRVRP